MCSFIWLIQGLLHLFKCCLHKGNTNLSICTEGVPCLPEEDGWLLGMRVGASCRRVRLHEVKSGGATTDSEMRNMGFQGLSINSFYCTLKSHFLHKMKNNTKYENTGSGQTLQFSITLLNPKPTTTALDHVGLTRSLHSVVLAAPGDKSL